LGETDRQSKSARLTLATGIDDPSCAVDWRCGRRPSDAHHIRFGQPRALGSKVSDEFTVPLCRVHHRDLHRRSDERSWWDAAKIAPMEIAERLWRETRDKSG
jgi:hypothetical protein